MTTAHDPLDLLPGEVKQLRAFMDGAIMEVDTRRHLWRSWGLCPRHAWAYVIVECELRARPLGCSILYEDLLSRALRLLTTPHLAPGATVGHLRPRATCYTCDYLAIVERRGSEPGDPGLTEGVARVNTRPVFSELVLGSRTTWEGRSCPRCLHGYGPLCRPHVIQAGAAPGNKAIVSLESTLDHLHTFVKSMTWRGPERTTELEASLIEALGWFTGWQWPAAVARIATQGTAPAPQPPLLRRVTQQLRGG